MSKSLSYCKEKYGDKYNFDIAKERTSEKYFNILLNGDRERIVEYKDGLLKIIINFERNDTYDEISIASGERDGFINDLDDQIYAFIRAELEHNNSKNIHGGTPEPGDALKITYGNLVYINNIINDNNELRQQLTIMVPKKYKRIVGGLNEQVDSST